MQAESRLKYLKTALVGFGGMFIIGIYLMMMIVWPSGFGWTPRHPEAEAMIIGVYAVVGIFMIRAAKDPPAHASFIWFVIWSSLVHAAIMMVLAIIDDTERANLVGDIPTLFLVGFVLWFLMPKKVAESFDYDCWPEH